MFFILIKLILLLNLLVEVGQHVLYIITEHIVLVHNLDTKAFGQVS